MSAKLKLTATTVDPIELADFERVYGQWAGRCFGLAMAMTTNRQLAEDAVQEAFYTCWRQRDRFDPSRSPLGSWLVLLTHHRVIDAVRREQRHRTVPVVDVIGDPELVDTAPGPAAQAESADQRATIRAAMATLSPVQREVLVLAYFGGHTQTQIASMLAIPLGTVKTRSYWALRRMRTELDAPGTERHSPV